MKHFVFTGATSGMGLVSAQALAARDKSFRIIVGARTPSTAVNLRQAIPDEQLLILQLDTSSLSSVKTFGSEVTNELKGASIAGLALNAGAQFVSETALSEDGYDLTFATNVLGHMALYNALAANMTSNTVVVSTASGTHDESNALAKSSGFRGGFFPSATDVARGTLSNTTNTRQAGLDRYATSKLCNVMFTYAMARRVGNKGPRFIALDPGMMPGTGLARNRSKAIQVAWKTVLPTMVRFMDGASTPERSGKILADILAQELFDERTGLHVEYTGKEIPSSPLSYDETKQDALVEFSMAAIAA